MPRLHIWAICASALTFGPTFVYYRFYLPRITVQQDGELALEAERFSVQRLHQRAILLKSVKPKTNSEKLRLFADVQCLINDVSSNPRVGREDEETIRTILAKVQSVRCGALVFRNTDESPLAWWMKMHCAVAFGVHFVCIRVIIKIFEVFTSLVPLAGPILFLPIAQVRRLLAQGILRMLKLDVTLVDVETEKMKELRESEEAIRRREGTASDAPDQREMPRSSLLLEAEQKSGVAFQGPFVFAPRGWIDEVVIHAVLPLRSRVIFCRAEPIERIGEGDPVMLSPSFGYPLRPRVSSRAAMVRPLVVRFVEPALAIPEPPGMTCMKREIKLEQMQNYLLEGQTDGPFRTRDQNTGLIRRFHKPGIIEEASRLAVEESKSFAFRLHLNFSPAQRLHLYSFLPLSVAALGVYGGDAPRGKKKHLEVSVQALERTEPADVWQSIMASHSEWTQPE